MNSLRPLMLAAALLAACAVPALADEAEDRRKAIEMQKQNEEAEALCRVVREKDQRERCLELYFTDERAFAEFLKDYRAGAAQRR